MRITKEQLLNIAKDTVKSETFGGNHDLICAYLTGSMLLDEPLIGGATDIDLIFVHAGNPPVRREIRRLNDEIHVDLLHFPRAYFEQPRQLRTDAWVGSFICQTPLVLYEENHWFDYTRAAGCANFQQPANILERVSVFQQTARSDWLSLQGQAPSFSPSNLHRYAQIIENAANAITCLTNPPLTDRRFFLNFQPAAMAIQMPGLIGGLIDLVLPAEPIDPDWDTWLAQWTRTYHALLQQEHAPIKYDAARESYYLSAIKSLQQDENQAALWLLFKTWTEMMNAMPNGNHACHQDFSAFCEALMLTDEHFAARMTALDAFLDAEEAAIDGWKQAAGFYSGA